MAVTQSDAPPITEEIMAADKAVVAAAKDLKVLSVVGWPPGLAQTFLDGWHRGDPKIPEPPKVDPKVDNLLAALEKYQRPVCDHPVAHFIARTARSYYLAAKMLKHIGTKEFTEHSIRIYGSPKDICAPGGLTNISAANNLLAASVDLAESCKEDEGDYCVTPLHVQMEMKRIFDKVFDDEPLPVIIDPSLSSKAAAGAANVRIRSATCFTHNDITQLVYHEGLVHSATARNGRKQPKLKCLSLGAPRTTATQEGLATFSELITNAIDLNRLRRLALRIKGIDMALDGADFIDVFKFFLDSDQTDKESYFSAARVFRGGDPRGGVAFTKDTVYLRGLLRTKVYFLAALNERKVEFIKHIFVGRLTWGDVMALEPWLRNGDIIPPRYIPDWAQRRECIAAFLAVSSLTHSLPMEKARLSDFEPPSLDSECFN